MLSEPQTLLSPPTSVCQQWLTENPGEPLHRGCFSSYGLHFTNAQSTPEASGNAHPWKQHSAQDGQEFEGSVPSLPHPLGVITPRSIRHHLPEFHSGMKCQLPTVAICMVTNPFRLPPNPMPRFLITLRALPSIMSQTYN